MIERFMPGDIVIIHAPSNADEIWTPPMIALDGTVHRVEKVYSYSFGDIVQFKECGFHDPDVGEYFMYSFDGKFLEHYVENVFVGDKVVIKKPFDVHEKPKWTKDMDKYDGVESVVVRMNGDFVRVKGIKYSFNAKWLVVKHEEKFECGNVLELF